MFQELIGGGIVTNHGRKPGQFDTNYQIGEIFGIIDYKRAKEPISNLNQFINGFYQADLLYEEGYYIHDRGYWFIGTIGEGKHQRFYRSILLSVLDMNSKLMY